PRLGRSPLPGPAAPRADRARTHRLPKEPHCMSASPAPSPDPATRPAPARTSEPTTTSAAAIARRPRRMPSVTTMARRVTLAGLNAYYGDNHAVKGIDLEFAPNEVTAIIGPSGC